MDLSSTHGSAYDTRVLTLIALRCDVIVLGTMITLCFALKFSGPPRDFPGYSALHRAENPPAGRKN